MENTEAKVKYIGEIVAILCLEIIMLLFRMVQPIVWPAKVPLVWQNFGNEFIFAGIEFGLIIVIVAHFIFKISFKEMGLTHFKENIGSLIGNLCFVGLCVGVSLFASQFSKLAEFNSLNIGLQIAVNFVAIAFIKEIVFRGLLFQSILKLSNGKGILASILSGILFAITYIPNILINLNEVHTSDILSALAIPLVLGIYLGLVYYYGRNLWLCMIIQGVCLSMTTLGSDIFVNLLAGVYSLGLLIYLVYKIVSYYKHGDEEDEDTEIDDEMPVSDEEVAIESEQTKEVEEKDKAEDDQKVEIHAKVNPSKEIDESIQKIYDGVETINKIEVQTPNEKPHKVQLEEIIEVSKEEQLKEVEEEREKTDISKEQMLKEVIEHSEEVKEVEEKQFFHEEKSLYENKVVEVPKFKNLESTPTEEFKHDLQEELDKTIIMPNLTNEIDEAMKDEEQVIEEEENLGKIAAIPNTQEELGKVVNLQARKEKMAQAVEKAEDLEITVIMPCITEADIKQEKTRFEPKDKELMIQAEPNFIAHLEKYLGDFEGIYKQVIPTEIPIDILYFSGEKYDAIVTNGMRAMVMSVPPELDDYKQAELMMFIDKSFSLSEGGLQREESAWLITLLTDLALYPKQINSYLGWGHIVGNGEELEVYDASVAYCGALIYPPMMQEDVTFYRYIEKDRNIFIHNVMPLFKEELRFIQEHSSEQFVNLMSEMGVNQVIKPERLNIIKNMNRSF